MKSERFVSTALFAEIAFASTDEIEADAERAMRRARWERRKQKRGN
jgi:hypothetical protein